MGIFEISLILAATLCSFVAGFLFAYAVVIMPGIKKLDDKSFIQAFQVTDKIIQDNNPLFIVVWLGSAVSVIVCGATAFGELEGTEFILLMVAGVAYIVGVQVSTVVTHLPLNNKLQGHNTEAMSDEELGKARSDFEGPWNRSNQRRTFIACWVSFLLIFLATTL